MEARVIWVTVTSHTKTWLTALILLNTLNKVQRPFLLPSIRHLPTHEKRRPTLPQSRWLGVEPQGLSGALEGVEQSGPLRCLNQRPSRGREAFSVHLIPPTNPTTSKYRDRKEKRDTHTRMHSTEQKRHKRLEVKKMRNQLHKQTATEERELTAGSDRIHAVVFKRSTKPLYLHLCIQQMLFSYVTFFLGIYLISLCIPWNRIHDLGVVSNILYCLSNRNAVALNRTPL